MPVLLQEKDTVEDYVILVNEQDEELGVREKLQARARSYMVPNRDLFRDWVESLSGLLAYREPRAGAYAFLEYQGPMPSTELGDRWGRGNRFCGFAVSRLFFVASLRHRYTLP